MGGMKSCGMLECHVRCRNLPGCVHDYRGFARTGAKADKWHEALIFAGIVAAVGVAMVVIHLVTGG